MTATPDAQAICELFDLGEPVAEMTRVSGGLTNRMWRLETSRGAFAIKEMNRDWMRVDYVEWFDRAFSLEQTAFAAGIRVPRPVPVAATGRCLGELPSGNERPITVRAHEWVDAEAVPAVVYPPPDAARIGAILARIHALKIATEVTSAQALKVGGEQHWSPLAERVERADFPWAWEFRAHLPIIFEMESYVDAARTDPTPALLSHRDADQKNFLRDADGEFVLVDWDAAGPVNPRHDVANQALTWAGAHLGEPDRAVLRGFLDGYRQSGGGSFAFEPSDLAEMVNVQIWWLEFCIRRALSDAAADRSPADGYSRGVEAALRRRKLHRYSTSIERWIGLLNRA